jgi:hypothetical protein
MHQHALKEYSNDPAVWQLIQWGGPHRRIRSCGRGHIESPVPREGPHQKVQSHGRGHSRKSDPAGGATEESSIPREWPPRKVRSLSLSLPMSLSLSSPKRVDPTGGATP